MNRPILNIPGAALMLEGGAMRSMFTNGVLDFFLDKNLMFPNVIGISAGTFEALCYVSEQRGRNFKANVEYASDKRYMGLSHLIKEGSYFNFGFMLGKLAREIYPFDEHTFEQSDIRFYATVTDCLTAKPVYPLKQDFSVKEFILWCQASCSIPIASKPVLIRGRYYVDGGVGMPLSPAPDELPFSCTKPVYILTRDIDYRKKKENIFSKTLVRVLFGRKYPELTQMINTISMRYNRKAEKLIELEKEGKIFIIRPIYPVHMKRTEHDPQKLEAFYHEGYEVAKSRYEDLMRYLYE